MVLGGSVVAVVVVVEFVDVVGTTVVLVVLVLLGEVVVGVSCQAFAGTENKLKRTAGRGISQRLKPVLSTSYSTSGIIKFSVASS